VLVATTLDAVVCAGNGGAWAIRSRQAAIRAAACQCGEFQPPWARVTQTGIMVTESIVTETATRIFADLADPQSINRAPDGAWRAPLWQALVDAGLTLAWVPEGEGGTGASLADGFAILGVAGRFAAPAPLAETLLAGWLLSCAGIASPDGAMTVAPTRQGERITLAP